MQLQRHFLAGGVHWLTVGQLTDSKGKVDKDKLLSKLKTIITRLDQNTTHPLNDVEAATDYLRRVNMKWACLQGRIKLSPMQVISVQYPKSLLILDDVWSLDVANAFAVRCPTLVTSRNSGLAKGILVSEEHKYCVSVAEGECMADLANVGTVFIV